MWQGNLQDSREVCKFGPMVIQYRAKLTYVDSDGRQHEEELCDIRHTMNPRTLQTEQFEFAPVKENL